MSSTKANGDPLEGTIAVPNYGAVDVYNNVAMHPHSWANGEGNARYDVTAPTTVVVSSPSKTTTTVNLSWTVATDNVQVSGYRVFKAGVQVGADLPFGTNTYVATGLTTATAYAFTVKSFDENGTLSVASNSLSVTTN
jgi:hypothetical protein